MAALSGEDGPFGLLLVGDHAGDVDTFRADDKLLLETFAGHASVMIENGRLERSLAEVTDLKERLRHQAFHDILTGLPNRALFTEKVEAAVGRGDGAAAVLFLDLDDFKAINDTFGHADGDEVLVEVGRRVQRAIRADDTAARIGGDEFAVLLESSDATAARSSQSRCSTRSPGRSFCGAGRRASIAASGSRPPPRRRAPQSCSRTPTSRCTAPRASASTASPISSRKCTPRSVAATSSRSRCRAPSNGTRSCRSSSPWSTCGIAASSHSRRSRAGARPTRARRSAGVHPGRGGDRPHAADRRADPSPCLPCGASVAEEHPSHRDVTVSVNLSPRSSPTARSPRTWHGPSSRPGCRPRA